MIRRQGISLPPRNLRRRALDLSALADLAQIIGSIGVLVAVVFGVSQIRQYQQQRADSAASELIRPFQEADFTRAFTLMQPVPTGISDAELRAAGGELVPAALTLGIRFETVGFLVYRGNIPFDLVYELFGGVTVYMWTKLERWVHDQRVVQQQPRFMEWFQWIAERFAERREMTQEPAFVKYRSWRPQP